MKKRQWRASVPAACIIAVLGLAACEPGGFPDVGDQVFAPGIDYSADGVDGAEVGHRLLAAGEYELALKAFNREALERGALDTEILAGLGAANLGLRRLGQAETLLRRAAANPDAQASDLNNLAVVLMETGQIEEAQQYFQRAFALANGQSDSIRDNLRLALAKTEKSATDVLQNTEDFELVRRGRSEFTVKPLP